MSVGRDGRNPVLQAAHGDAFIRGTSIPDSRAFGRKMWVRKKHTKTVLLCLRNVRAGGQVTGQDQRKGSAVHMAQDGCLCVHAHRVLHSSFLLLH